MDYLSFKEVNHRFMRKNILILSHSYGPQFIDISNQYTLLFDKEKYHVTVAYLIGVPDLQIEAKHCADKVIFLNSRHSSIRYLKLGLIAKLIKLCREKQFEIVICHRYKPSYSMLWAAQFCRIGALFFVMHELGTLNHLTRKLTVAGLTRKNMLFAGVSEAVCRDLQQHIWRVPTKQVITLHNMIDVATTESQLLDKVSARKKLGLSIDDFIFGTVGRLAINKDQRTLIKAFSLIKEKCPKAKLVIAGDGPLHAELMDYVKQLNLTSTVIFTGFLNDAFCYMKAFDGFILSSTQEAFGRVLLEAMVAEIPIIATAANGIPEVVGDAGIIVPPANAEKLAEAMALLYHSSSETRHLNGLKGYDRAVQHFSIPRFNEIFWTLPLMKQLKEFL